MSKYLVLPVLYALFGTLLAVSVLSVSTAQVMQSSNYQIQSDSVNVGGNDTGSSTNYNVYSTIGEVGTGPSGSASYELGAGYRQMQEVYLALTGADSVTMALAIPGVTGGTVNGSSTITVVTDSPSGYALTITAENSPAMQKGADTIADYAPVGAAPDFNYTVDDGEANFGFSPSGVDVVDRFKDDGGSCDTGSLNTDLSCWDGLAVTPKTIAQNTSPNHPTGATTTVNFRVGVGTNANQAPGFYVATTTITALPL